jgi:Fe-S cluster assembly protein SufB
MVHVGKNTRSRIVSKGISAGNSTNAYRGLVQVQPTARGEWFGAITSLKRIT